MTCLPLLPETWVSRQATISPGEPVEVTAASSASYTRHVGMIMFSPNSYLTVELTLLLW